MAEPPRARQRGWLLGTASGILALAALVAGSAFGTVSPKTHRLDPRLIIWISAAVLLVFGALAVTRISALLARHVTTTSVPSAGGAVRVLSAGVGYLMVIFAVLAELHVQIEKLLVGAGLAGIVLGIAAQQSLGNAFAGMVLMLTRPFRVGDRVRVRSGALGGIFDARVREMTLTFVTLQTEEGEYKIPNSAMLAAGVARTPRTPLPGASGTPNAQPAPPKPPTSPAQAAEAPAGGAAGRRAVRRAARPSPATRATDGDDVDRDALLTRRSSVRRDCLGPDSGGVGTGRF